VKGVEGVPEGNLDQFLFAPNDPAFDRLPPQVASQHRRTSLSCYAWPGVRPKECMENYGIQVEPVLRVLLEKDLDSIDAATGPYYERAVARAEVFRWRPTP
jgi:alanine dehydrogenase